MKPIITYLGAPRFQPGSWQAIVAAVAIMVAAMAVRAATFPLLPNLPFAVFFPAVVIVAFVSGTAAAVFSIALSATLVLILCSQDGISSFELYQGVIFIIGAGTVTGVVGGMRVATANVRRLNATLSSNEAKFRSLLESAPDAFVIVDERHSIALVNAQTEAMFGYRREELLGQPVALLMPEDSRASCAARLSSIIADPLATPADRIDTLYGLRRGGDRFPIDVGFAPLKTESGVLVSGAIRDITARRQIEANLAEASKAKSEFLATMSHELRTPLNAIIGFSEMIRESPDGAVDARYREYANDINESGRHLQAIINDILDISQIGGGGLKLREEPIPIEETIDSCRRVIAAMAHKAGVTLSVEIPRMLPLIRGDQMRIKQVLLNLMSNAVKFTPAGGRVSISAQSDADGLSIAVKDTGIGMSPDDLAVAVQPFRQIDSALSRRFAGTGLGLPLAKALMELHGGWIDIDSEPGKGTTATMCLPANRIIDREMIVAA